VCRVASANLGIERIHSAGRDADQNLARTRNRAGKYDLPACLLYQIARISSL